MVRVLKYAVCFALLAGIGILLGCYIHGARTGQPTIMSGVAFVRELPYGEKTVGLIETTVFSYQEKKSLEDFQKQHEGQIQIDPEVRKQQEELFRKRSGRP
jgi:hypothetical protein